MASAWMCGPVSLAAFVNCTSMCGLEPKREALSKAAFCWLGLHLLVCVHRATSVLFQVKFMKMAQTPPRCGATEAMAESPATPQQPKAGRDLGYVPGSRHAWCHSTVMSEKILWRKPQGPLGSHFPTEGKNTTEKGGASDRQLSICLFTLCRRLWDAWRFRKVARDLRSWILRLYPKYFYAFLVKTQTRGRNGSWQDSKYLS